jgi:hypothetical protein
MKATVRVFTLASGAPPQPAPSLMVEAKTHDGLRRAARAELASKGRLRALSFTPAGELVAYVEVGA